MTTDTIYSRLRGRLPGGIKRTIRKKLGLAKTLDFLGHSEKLLADPRRQFQTPFWYEGGLGEHNVVRALEELVQPGQTVFDVGANSGATSICLSRMVGPRGLVCAFEASPRIVDKCNYNLVSNACYNVFLHNKAVYKNSDETVRIVFGTHLNDSIYNSPEGAPGSALVETIALDDFARHWNLWPDVIKFDIEGAEYDALLGATTILNDKKPHLILEQSPQDDRCLNHLKSLGYRALDAGSYQSIDKKEDYPAGTDIANAIFIHESRFKDSPFAEMEIIPHTEMDLEDFIPEPNQGLRGEITLGPGHYLLESLFDASGTDNHMEIGIKADDQQLVAYSTQSRFLATSYRYWVLKLKREQALTVFYRFLRGTQDPSFVFKGLIVRRVMR